MSPVVFKMSCAGRGKIYHFNRNDSAVARLWKVGGR